MDTAISHFHFLRPGLLLLAPVAGLVWWLWRRQSDPMTGWRAQVDPDLLAALVDGETTNPRRQWLLPVAWLVAVIALAGPSWKPEPSPFSEDATPLIILLKADTSMDTPDPEPSRMERARMKISDLAVARKGQSMGLIAWAGSAHLVLPPTKDTAAIARMAQEISPQIMPEAGARLDLAIARAAELPGAKGATLLIITDAATDATPEITHAYKAAGSPDVLIFSISPLGLPADSLRPLAKSLGARLVSMSSDDSDTAEIVRASNHPASVTTGKETGETHWQDGGYYLLPLLAILALLPFRRESPTPLAT